jgi:hypothetical protein
MDLLVPAGTLLQCTMQEPNFSSRRRRGGSGVVPSEKASESDARFPAGSILARHLEDEEDPGHWQRLPKITFDRVIVLRNIRYGKGDSAGKVDKQGDIKGKGHPKRDVVEWMIPPLWPWKVVSLPARGPRPTLKGEEPMQLRLMDDIVVPRNMSASLAVPRNLSGSITAPRNMPVSFTAPNNVSAAASHRTGRLTPPTFPSRAHIPPRLGPGQRSDPAKRRCLHRASRMRTSFPLQ